MTRKSLVATVVGIAAVAAPSAFADKGGIPHDGSSGQGRPAAQEQGTAQAPRGKALAKGHAKTHAKAQAKANGKSTSHPSGSGLAKGHTKSTTTAPKTTGTPSTNTHAKAGKTTICHATGSTTNPYVTITISNNAIPAHQSHQDGRDIIPAPGGGCPGASQPTNGDQQQHGGQPGGEGKTTICHATGSATNPYVTITISNNAIPAHQSHQDGRDIIPAPAGGCPGSPQGSENQPGTTTELPGGPTEQQPVAPFAAPGAQPTTGTPQSGVLGTSTGSSSPSRSGVLGESTSSGSPSASAAPAATATRAASSSKLPFTGTDVIIVAILGLAALLVGITARRASSIKS